VLEENIGPVRCAVSKHDGASFAEFDLAKLPEPLELSADPEAIGAALGLRRTRSASRTTASRSGRPVCHT
jgi:predicted PhzF superfamily epimerase YddE/YHI9